MPRMGIAYKAHNESLADFDVYEIRCTNPRANPGVIRGALTITESPGQSSDRSQLQRKGLIRCLHLREETGERGVEIVESKAIGGF
jgi:hypothetical protein